MFTIGPASKAKKYLQLLGLTAQGLRVAAVEQLFCDRNNDLHGGGVPLLTQKDSQRHNSWASVFTKKSHGKVGCDSTSKSVFISRVSEIDRPTMIDVVSRDDKLAPTALRPRF
jgi:hypothetical protein